MDDIFGNYDKMLDCYYPIVSNTYQLIGIIGTQFRVENFDKIVLPNTVDYDIPVVYLFVPTTLSLVWS